MKRYLAKLHSFAKKHDKKFFIVSLPFLTLLLFMGFVHISELYQIGIMGNDEGYPWGCKCAVPWYYASPGTYLLDSAVELVIVFLLFYFTIRLIMKKLSLYAIALILLYLLVRIPFGGMVYGLWGAL